MNLDIFDPSVLLNLPEFDQCVKMLLEARAPIGTVAVSFGKPTKMKGFLPVQQLD